MNYQEILLNNLKLIYNNRLVDASVLIQNNNITKIGKQPVLSAIPEIEDRKTIDCSKELLLRGLHDHLSWLDDFTSEKAMQRFQLQLWEGGITSYHVFWGNSISRIKWLDQVRTATKVLKNATVYGSREYIERWQKLELIDQEIIGYYPSNEKNLLPFPFNSDDDLQSIKEDHNFEVDIHKSLGKGQVLIGSTIDYDKNKIPFTHSLYYDTNYPRKSTIPLREKRIREKLYQKFDGKIAIGHGHEHEELPGLEIGQFAFPLVFDLVEKDVFRYGPIQEGDSDFITVSKGGLRKATNGAILDDRIPTPKFHVAKTIVNGNLVFNRY